MPWFLVPFHAMDPGSYQQVPSTALMRKAFLSNFSSHVGAKISWEISNLTAAELSLFRYSSTRSCVVAMALWYSNTFSCQAINENGKGGEIKWHCFHDGCKLASYTRLTKVQCSPSIGDPVIHIHHDSSIICITHKYGGRSMPSSHNGPLHERTNRRPWPWSLEWLRITLRHDPSRTAAKCRLQSVTGGSSIQIPQFFQVTDV